jgi:hypothetical protein
LQSCAHSLSPLECVYEPIIHSLGLSSAQTVVIIAEMSEYFQIDLPTTFLYDYPTVNDITAFITNTDQSTYRQSTETTQNATVEHELRQHSENHLFF